MEMIWSWYGRNGSLKWLKRFAFDVVHTEYSLVKLNKLLTALNTVAMQEQLRPSYIATAKESNNKHSLAATFCAQIIRNLQT